VDGDLEWNFETYPFNEYRLNHEMEIRPLFGLSRTISYGDIDDYCRLLRTHFEMYRKMGSHLIIPLTGEHYEKVIVNLNDGRCRM
jgi:hypothetical protein